MISTTISAFGLKLVSKTPKFLNRLPIPTFITSSRSSAVRKKTELLKESGSELLKVTVSCANRRVRIEDAPPTAVVLEEESEDS